MRVLRASSSDRWQSRPLLAALLRLVLLAVPVLTSCTAVVLLGRYLPDGATRTWWGLGLMFAVAVVVATIVERGARRLLPLTVLLKLTMVFPDRAPSRFKVARAAVVRNGSDEILWTGPGGTPTTTSEAVLSLIASLGAHDRKTRGHSERVRVLCDMLAAEVKLDDAARDRLRWASLLHDVGKLNVSATILNKPAALDRAEFDAVKQHPAMGAELVGPLLPFLGDWGKGIAEHHERYDGSGYPAGLAGREISEAGRLLAVVDAYETMTAGRSYKTAMATKTAREELARCAGSHFDPVYVRAFLAISLPRVLWAMGPVSFFIQLPFLRPLAEAGARAGIATGEAAGRAAHAAAVASAGVAVSGAAVAGAVSSAPPVPLPSTDAVEVAAPLTAGAGQGNSGRDGSADADGSLAAPRASTGSPVTPQEPGRVGGSPAPTAAAATDDGAGGATGVESRLGPDPRPPAPQTSPSEPDEPNDGDGDGDQEAERGAKDAKDEQQAEETDDLRTVLTGKPADPTTSRSAAFAFSNPEGFTTFECRLMRQGQSVGLPTRWEDCVTGVTYAGLETGRHRFSVRVVDGDVKGEPTSYTWEIVEPDGEQEGAVAADGDQLRADEANSARRLPEPGEPDRP